MKKVGILVLLLIGIGLCLFVGKGCTSKEIVVTTDPKEIERLAPMMPGRPGQPAPPAGGQAEPAE